ncbi:unnamed protein product, partial [Polarella glacialis]
MTGAVTRGPVAVATAGIGLVTAATADCYSHLGSFALSGAASCTLYPEDAVPGEIAGIIGPESHEVMGNGVDQYTNVSVPTLTPFIVQGSDVAVVIAPGGGYSILDFNGEGADIAAWLNSIGVSAFLLKYRVPERPWLGFGGAPLMDAQRAVGLLRFKAQELGLNASKIGFMGFSAGGHLTAHISNNYSARSYARVDAADDVSARPDFALLIYPWALVSDDTPSSRLLVNVSASTPSSFLAQAEDDGTAPVENSIFYFLGL